MLPIKLWTKNILNKLEKVAKRIKDQHFIKRLILWMFYTNEHVGREKGSKKKSKKEKRKSVIARDEIRAQRSDSPVGEILLDYVIPIRTPPPNAIRRSKRIRFVRGAVKKTNDLTDIRPMLTEEQINRGEFGFISEAELHKKMPKIQKDKNCPSTMTRFERLKRFGKAPISEPIDDIYAEEKLGWAIGTITDPTATIEGCDGEIEDVSSFVSSEVRTKWRVGCEPGEASPLAFTNLGPLVGQFYSRTTFKSRHYSTGTLFFSTSSFCKLTVTSSLLIFNWTPFIFQ